MKKLITETDILNLLRQGVRQLVLEKGTVITPSAIDRMKHSGMLVVDPLQPQQSGEKAATIVPKFRTIAVGSDHTGFSVKVEIMKYLQEKQIVVTDVGCKDTTACDYPDFAYAVAKKVKAKEVDAGILFDATGIPSAITANKVKGIRAVTCYNEFSARSSREHNNANVVVLGARSLGIETIKSILDVWLYTDFLGGRHQKRLDKISEIERNSQ